MTTQVCFQRQVDYYLVTGIKFSRLDPRSAHALDEYNIDFSSVNVYQTIETSKKRASFDDDGTDEENNSVTLIERRKRRRRSKERKPYISIWREGFTSSPGHEELFTRYHSNIRVSELTAIKNYHPQRENQYTSNQFWHL